MDLSRKSSVYVCWGIACLVPFLVGAKKFWVDGVLVRVNEQTLTLSEFEQHVSDARKDTEASGAPVDEKALRESVLQNVLQEMLVLERAKELGYTASKADLDRALDSIRERNRLPDVESVYAAAQSTGVSRDQLNEQFRRQILAERIMQADVFGQRDVTEWEIREYYKKVEKDYLVPEQFHLKVLALFNAKTLSTKRDAVRKALGEGGAFDALVQHYTEGPSPAQGGDIGLVSPKDLSGEMQEALKALKPGEVTPPVEMRGGIYFAQLVEVVPAHPRPFEEVRAEISDRMMKEKFKDKIQKYIDDLKKRYLTVINKSLLEEPK